LSRIAIVFTGGTISMQPDATAGGNRPVLDGAAILARAPSVADVAQIDVVDWGLVPASHLSFGQIIDIAAVVAAQLKRPEIDGAVVVQGTDVIEETAFAYDLLVDSAKPVVVTGAMRDSASPDYDGPRNLEDAVRVAADQSMQGSGVSVVMAGLVIAADQAVKTHSTSLNTFQPRDGGPIATVEDGIVRLLAARGPRRTLGVGLTVDAAVEDVHLVTAVVGMNGSLLRGLTSSGAQRRGVVVAATGSGNTHPDLLAAATELMAAGTVVVLTTRCAQGSVDPIYAFPGGGATWQRAGAVLSDLDGPKSRVALALALAAGRSQGEIAALLAGPSDS
jgi:L-asparaginase